MRKLGLIGHVVFNACLLAAIGLGAAATGTEGDGAALGMLCILPVGLAGLAAFVVALAGTIACWRERRFRLLGAIEVICLGLFGLADVEPIASSSVLQAASAVVVVVGCVAAITLAYRGWKFAPDASDGPAVPPDGDRSK